MNCPNCGHPVRGGAKFCEECGIVLPVMSATEAAQPGATAKPAAGPVAPTRRAAPYRAQAASAEDALQEPSGTTMLPPPNIGQARRTFAMVAVGLIVLLCCCCAGAAGILIYLISQPTGQMPLPGLM
jgi:zinc ribbon protein